MTRAGPPAGTWSFSTSFALPAALITAEATWVSLLAGAVVDSSTQPHLHLSFWLLALVALAAAAAGSGAGGLAWRWRWKAPILAGVVGAGVALSAGVLAMATPGVSAWVVATHPWAVAGHRPSVTATAAWILAAMAWTRGTALGIRRPSLGQAAWSAAVGAAAFLGIVAARADSSAVAFRAATEPAGWMLCLAFPLAMTAVALARQHALAEEVLPGSAAGPGGLWLAVLGGPMLAVALVAIGLAFTVGPAGRALGRAVTWLGRSLLAAGRDLWRLLPRGGHQGAATVVSGAGRRPGLHAVGRSHPATHISPVLAELVVVAAAVLGALFLLRHFRVTRGRRGMAPTTPDAEQRDSVFSWTHLLGQLRVLLASLAHRRRRVAPVVSAAGAGGLGPGHSTVRGAYRQVLQAASGAGHGRRPAETTGEFQTRLRAGPVREQTAALAALTEAYDAVRYGNGDDAIDADGAWGQAEAVSSELVRPELMEPGP